MYCKHVSTIHITEYIYNAVIGSYIKKLPKSRSGYIDVRFQIHVLGHLNLFIRKHDNSAKSLLSFQNPTIIIIIIIILVLIIIIIIIILIIIIITLGRNDSLGKRKTEKIKI